MDQTLTHRIRERAYHIWTQTGGTADQNWLEAETEILQTPASITSGDQSSKKRPRKSGQKQQTVARAL
jgi:Protein of unknown function (DUF2934)